eukprot:CAMPEP_0169106590 /NCGR_PEP_ID=MMETSP1015-20121227/24421_1 /TAXON_ID=342587 /ORGANISM="Karlodinium micrum, Strain CCMP2283" /LENGTH=200 /DNA_ID=CAMNT_0009168047 /DNA_START=88 /DNA_END=686 /DNA_ORIENTATION=-
MTLIPELGPAFPVVIPIGAPKNHNAEQLGVSESVPTASSGGGSERGVPIGYGEPSMWKALSDVIVARLENSPGKATHFYAPPKTSFMWDFRTQAPLPPAGPGLGMGAAPPPGLAQIIRQPPHAAAYVSGPSVRAVSTPPPGLGTPVALGAWASAAPNGDGGSPLAMTCANDMNVDAYNQRITVGNYDNYNAIFGVSEPLL